MFNGLCSFWGGCWWFLLVWGGWWWIAFSRVLSFQTLKNILQSNFLHIKYFIFENILHQNKQSVNNSLYNTPHIKDSIFLPLHLNILFLFFLYIFFILCFPVFSFDHLNVASIFFKTRLFLMRNFF